MIKGVQGKDYFRIAVHGKHAEKLEKLEDGKSKIFSFKVDVKPGYTYFVRVGARVDDTFQKCNYTEIVKVEIPQK